MSVPSISWFMATFTLLQDRAPVATVKAKSPKTAVSSLFVSSPRRADIAPVNGYARVVGGHFKTQSSEGVAANRRIGMISLMSL
jgi:hypothetical protein